MIFKSELKLVFLVYKCTFSTEKINTLSFNACGFLFTNHLHQQMVLSLLSTKSAENGVEQWKILVHKKSPSC